MQVLSHVPPLQRERVAQLMLAPHYLRRLLDHFKVNTNSSHCTPIPVVVITRSFGEAHGSCDTSVGSLVH